MLSSLGTDRSPGESVKNDAGCDLRSVRNRVESEAVLYVIEARRPTTDFGENAAGEIAANDSLDLPHQAESNVEACDLMKGPGGQRKGARHPSEPPAVMKASARIQADQAGDQDRYIEQPGHRFRCCQHPCNF